MKPPSRVRAKPDRYSHRKKIDLKKHRKKRLICGSWKRTEQRNLLIGLRKQSKCTGGTGYINFKALNQKIPQRTIQELETMVETLKSHAVTVTVQQLSRQRRTALAARVPIEVWSQLAEDAAGSVVDPVTSAFSQMMFLCSTEPRSLRNSDPPRRDHCDAQVPSDARTIPFRPMPMPNPALVTLPKPALVTLPNPPTATVSTSRIASTSESDPSATSTTVTPARLISGSPASGCGRLQSNSPASILPPGQPGGSDTTSASLRGSAEQSSPQPASSSNSTSTSSSFNTTTTSSSSTSTTSSSTPAPSSMTTSSSSSTTTPSSMTTSSSSTTTSSSMTTSSSSSTPPLSSSNTTTSSSTRFGRTSKFAQKDSPRTMGLRCIVDFEKIYSYLSQVHKVNQEHCLTPMESAVVLDVLLSLPEELPLLDCVRLEQHMIQAHASLTSPVDRSEAGSNMDAQEAQDGGGAEPVGGFHQAQVSGGREAGIGPLPDGQDRDGLQPTNQVEAAVATEAPGILVPPRSVAMDAAQLQRATAGREGHADGQSPSSQNASGQSRSSSRCQEKVTNGKATVCPLNPFMVPLQLLARRQAQ
ncbi:LOW QUALITY PROTEIN: snRNA-activating protein complex subunit 2 [Osmerus eperlanus]|uniref:LOW QUALITY PROTEIN: snRNA-activating protein complex subunit 2 n=1 Tax=Osmerus eperlanus TaxID=29151 RepID=UPI002E10B041